MVAPQFYNALYVINYKLHVYLTLHKSQQLVFIRGTRKTGEQTWYCRIPINSTIKYGCTICACTLYISICVMKFHVIPPTHCSSVFIIHFMFILFIKYFMSMSSFLSRESGRKTACLMCACLFIRSSGGNIIVAPPFYNTYYRINTNCLGHKK